MGSLLLPCSLIYIAILQCAVQYTVHYSGVHYIVVHCSAVYSTVYHIVLCSINIHSRGLCCKVSHGRRQKTDTFVQSVVNTCKYLRGLPAGTRVISAANSVNTCSNFT